MMKFTREIIVFCLFIAIFSVGKVNAKNVSFDIKANYAWQSNVADDPSIKQTNNKFSAVKWQTSSAGGSHKMWFRVLDDAGNVKGSGLFNYLATDGFKTYLTSGQRAYLSVRRPNLLDPMTRVTGIWTA